MAIPACDAGLNDLPDVVYSTRARKGTERDPDGVLVYLRTAADNDTLMRLDASGRTVGQSHFAILNSARCAPKTPAIRRYERHHDLVERADRRAAKEEKRVGGQLGRPSGARFRVYDRLKNFIELQRGTLFVTTELERAHQAIYRFPLRAAARDTLNRQLRSGISDEQLAELVTSLWQDGRLCLEEEGSRRAAGTSDHLLAGTFPTRGG